MSGVQSFKDLIVWQKSLELAKEIYRTTETLPKHEAFALTSQLRRSAVSIPSNIAEGSRRRTTRDLMQFLHIASGSASELETQLLIASDAYPRLNWAGLLVSLGEIQRMLTALMKKLR